jgi:hypothetical protein
MKRCKECLKNCMNDSYQSDLCPDCEEKWPETLAHIRSLSGIIFVIFPDGTIKTGYTSVEEAKKEVGRAPNGIGVFSGQTLPDWNTRHGWDDLVKSSVFC